MQQRASTTTSSTRTTMTTLTHEPLRGAVEIIQDKLYYVAVKSQPKEQMRNGRRLLYFNVDSELVYWNFFLDFGPLNLGQLYRFSTKLNDYIDQQRKHDQQTAAGTKKYSSPNTTIVFYSSIHPNKRANAIYLICAWQILYMNRTPEEAYRGFMVVDRRAAASVPPPARVATASNPPIATHTPTTSALPPFHDASPCACTYDLTILDCLRGLAKAKLFSFFNFDTFHVEEYEHFEQVENGDLNWIIQDRILAFAGPHYHRNVSPEGYCTLTPADYIPYFQKRNVQLVVRLNKKCYHESDFTSVGIRHIEQYYLDGSCPPMEILNRILQEFETVPMHPYNHDTTSNTNAPPAAFAVHCKAGLGRTGTCIGAYLMKHYKFTAAEAIGWMRICRPGMVIGPQQHFLQDIEQRMWHEGNLLRLQPSPTVRTTTIEDEEEDEEETRKEPNGGSPKSVTQGPGTIHFHDTSRPGQSEGLLARRNQHQGRKIAF